MHTDILLIDAYSQIFRSYYAIKALTNSRGEPTNAIFGFTKLLLNLEKNYSSVYGALLFDCGKPQFRLDLAPEYKANRPPTPEDLTTQVPFLKEIATAFGWPHFALENFEADDLIAVVSSQFSDKELFFISSDKDLAQLISDRVKMLVPDKMKGFAIRDYAAVIEKFQVKPEQIVDYLALIGDNSDNVPGIPGVGPKTAAKLLNQFPSINEILKNNAKVTNAKLRQKLLDNIELLRKNQKLITLKEQCGTPPWQSLDGLKRNKPDWEQVRNFCDRMELKSILREVDKLYPCSEKKVAADNAPKTQTSCYAPDLFD